MLACPDFDLEITAVPGVVRADGMRPGLDVQRHRIAEHQLTKVLAVEINLDLASLRVFRRIAKNRNASSPGFGIFRIGGSALQE
jgi:hypothetical protein